MKEGCGLCKLYGHGCQYHPDAPDDELRAVTSVDLNLQQLQAVEALVSREISETLDQVAERAGVTRMTLYRYLQQPEFVAEFRKRVEDELGAHRARVAAALVEGATSASQGQASMQRIYWQRLGELVERREHSGPGGGPIETRSTVDVSKLSTETLERLRDELTE